MGVLSDGKVPIRALHMSISFPMAGPGTVKAELNRYSGFYISDLMCALSTKAMPVTE